MTTREDMANSIVRVERYITEFISELDDNTGRILLDNFFGASDLYRLSDQFRFTAKGIGMYTEYYKSELPYRKYQVKLHKKLREE